MRLFIVLFSLLLFSPPVEAKESPSLQETLAESAPVITQRLDQALLKVGEWVETTESFAMEQAPFLVKEIIWWGVATSGYHVLLGLLLMLIGISYAIFSRRHYARWSQSRGDGPEVLRFLSFFVPIVTIVGGFIVFALNIMPALKPIVAPRLYLIEYFRALAG